MIAALIHPDGRLTTLRGELTTDHASIAALAHAVHAAGNELAVRVGTVPVQTITLKGSERSLTLFPTPQGVLLIEHESHETSDGVQALALQLQQLPAPVVPPAPPTAPISLADALHATAP